MFILKISVFDFSKVNVVREGKDAVIFACGLMVQSALKAAEKLSAEGKEVAVEMYVLSSHAMKNRLLNC